MVEEEREKRTLCLALKNICIRLEQLERQKGIYKRHMTAEEYERATKEYKELLFSD